MIAQTLPIGHFAHPFWESAANALHHSVPGSITIDIGATILAISRLSLAVVVALLCAAIAIDRTRAVLGFFAVGDAAIQTNPIYGRGCTFAAVEAYILRDVLNETADPELRVLSYCRHLHRELRPHYDAMRQMDRSAAEHAGTEASPEVRPSLRARVLRSLKEDGVTLAMRLHTDFLRERMRGIHMLEPPDAWKRRPKNIIRILRYWVTGRNKEAVAFSPAAGPKREEMMRALGLSHPPSADTTKLPDFV